MTIANRDEYELHHVLQDDSGTTYEQYEVTEPFYVLFDHDPHTPAALAAYADSCEADHPDRAAELRATLTRYEQNNGSQDSPTPPPDPAPTTLSAEANTALWNLVGHWNVLAEADADTPNDELSDNIAVAHGQSLAFGSAARQLTTILEHLA